MPSLEFEQYVCFCMNMHTYFTLQRKSRNIFTMLNRKTQIHTLAGSIGLLKDTLSVFIAEVLVD